MECTARSCHTGEARNALQHWLDQQAVYGCGHPASAGTGKLSLDDKVGKFIPGITRANEVTIRQLLSHTSGYQDYWPQDYVMPLMLQPVTAQKILDTWARKPLDFEPGRSGSTVTRIMSLPD